MRRPEMVRAANQPKAPRSPTRERGFMLLTALFVTSVLLLIAIPQTMRSLSSVRLEQLYVATQQAWYLKEGSFDNALRLLASGACVPPTGTTYTFANCPALAATGMAGPDTAYDAQITAPTAGSPSTLFRVQASGTSQGVTRRLEAAVERRSSALFRGALFASDWIKVGRDPTDPAFIDSYDSSKGAYRQIIAGLENVSESGHVETNRDDVSGIEVQTAASIRGTAVYDGSPPQSGPFLGFGGGTITQGVAAQPNPEPSYASLTPPPAPAVCTDITAQVAPLVVSRTFSGPGPFCADHIRSSLALDNGRSCISPPCHLTFTDPAALYVRDGIVFAAGGKLVWNRGTIVSGFVSVGGVGSRVDVSGKTDWYARDSFTLAFGSSLNTTTKIPANFRLYMSPGTTQGVPISRVHIATLPGYGYGPGEFYGVIYAPEQSVWVNNGSQIFGSVIGRGVLVEKSNLALPGDPPSAIHYDEALKNVTDFPGGTGGPSGSAVVTVKAVRTL